VDEGKVGIQKQLPLASIIVSKLLKELSIRVASRDTGKLATHNPAMRYLTIVSWSSVPQILVICTVWIQCHVILLNTPQLQYHRVAGSGEDSDGYQGEEDVVCDPCRDDSVGLVPTDTGNPQPCRAKEEGE